MLQINMADVMNVIGSLTPYLIAIGVLFVLALIITFAVNKKTVKEVATRKIVHSESWLVALVGIVVAVSMMLTGPLSTLLNNATITKYTLSDATVSKANELAKDVQSEAVTLLKNDDSNLPLSGKKVNVFGWGSTNPVYGGTGSGSMSKQYKTVSLLDGMKQAGLKTNTELSKLYTDYRKDRPEVGMFAQDWTLPEVPAKQYSDKLVSDAKDFSDEAVVVLTRVGGEGADLPTDMKAKGITYKNNSKDYDDFQKGESFLQLSKTERDMIDLVTSNFKKVTLVYNGANTFQFDFLNDYPQIQSVVWCPPAGQTGFSALGEVLAGETNPSGKTSDTFLKDLTKSVSYNNFGKFEYTNMADKAAKYKGFTGDDVTAIPGFVNYSEGIYVGYKFYETASDEGLINYDDTVAFPFGYGLSYTSFDQKLDSVKYKGGKVTVTATVTNTGDKAGKDVVEAYYNPPYTDGGIEKASKVLMPVLFLILVAIAVYALTLGSGVREGLSFYLKPDFSGITFKSVLVAMGQAFYSLSLGMGIMITYGSYTGKEVNLVRSTAMICIFDTLVALIAGLAIFPSVAHFDPALLGSSKGVALMFIILPQVFESMGGVGQVVSFAFFVMVDIAAITSVVSLIEVVTQFVIQKFHAHRKRAALIVAGVCFLVSIPIGISLGHVAILEESSPALFGLDWLTFFDEVTNTVLMPVCALFSCIVVGWFITPKRAVAEIEAGGTPMSGWLKKVYAVMIRFVTPALILIVEIGGLQSEIAAGNTAVIVFAYALVALCVVAYFAFFRNRDTGTNADEKLSGDYPV